jgi:hypothetical protein
MVPACTHLPYISISLCPLFNSDPPLHNIRGEMGALSLFVNCFMLLSYLAYSNLKMEAKCYSEKLVGFRRTTRRYISEHRTLCINVELSSVGIAAGLRIPEGATGFCFLHSFQTCFGVHITSYTVCTAVEAAGALS